MFRVYAYFFRADKSKMRNKEEKKHEPRAGGNYGKKASDRDELHVLQYYKTVFKLNRIP
jgi:hypothetical protein